VLLLLLLGNFMAVTAVELVGLPAAVGEAYDLTWTLQVNEMAGRPVELLLEQAGGRGYRLAIAPEGWRWEGLDRRQGVSTGGRLELRAGRTYAFTLKRRAGEVALLVDHRLAGTAPAPEANRKAGGAAGRIRVAGATGWAELGEVRYVPVGARRFGDDFMRPEGREDWLDHLRKHPDRPWFEDNIWQVAHYRKDWPGADPRDPASGRQMTAPWQLGVMLNTRVAPNGFWYLYAGSGPSWVVAEPRAVPPGWDRYCLQAAVKPEYGGAVGLIAAYQDNENYLLFRWEAEAANAGPRAALYEVREGKPLLLATARRGFQPRQWYALRLNLGWRAAEVWIDGVKLLEAANPGLIEGRVGLFADGARSPHIPEIDPATAALYGGDAARVDPSWTIQPIPCIYFDDVRVSDWREGEETPGDPWAAAPDRPLPEGLLGDAWQQTFAGDEALWTPAFAAKPANAPGVDYGAAAPLPTDAPGLYRHKGRHYHDLRATMPLGARLGGQTLHLALDDDPASGYRVALAREGKSDVVQFYRLQKLLKRLSFAPERWTHLRLNRNGDGLSIDLLAVSAGGVEAERRLFTYRDKQPLQAARVGFTVTEGGPPAAAVAVESDWRRETFAGAPTAWRTAGGVWGVMTRYACDPNWNWFGGYGAGTPTAWGKPALLGDQAVEAYLGVKMEYDNLAHESARRFRDMNLSICADGADPESGYTLTRGRIVDGKPVTQLLRRGTVVWSSSAPEDLMPTPKAGYRAWQALRLVKTGPVVEIFIDNRLTGAYTDPAPLPGGHLAVWTVNNGIVIGRVNYGAERILMETTD